MAKQTNSEDGIVTELGEGEEARFESPGSTVSIADGRVSQLDDFRMSSPNGDFQIRDNWNEVPLGGGLDVPTAGYYLIVGSVTVDDASEGDVFGTEIAADGWQSRCFGSAGNDGLLTVQNTLMANVTGGTVVRMEARTRGGATLTGDSTSRFTKLQMKRI